MRPLCGVLEAKAGEISDKERCSMATLTDQYRLDARPDRIDLRDRPYEPPLQSLEPEYPLVLYYKRLVLNQEKEGACTGFGLVATSNYLLWRRVVLARDKGKPLGKSDLPAQVSRRMLYHLARFYDEWPGCLGLCDGSADGEQSLFNADPTTFDLFRQEKREYQYQDKLVKPWNEGNAYDHTVVMGNDGLVINRLVVNNGPVDTVDDIVVEKPAAWFAGQGGDERNIVLYAHGGLNSEGT